MSTIAQGRDIVPAGVWQVDAAHSQVGFGIEYMGGTFRGTFSPVEAELQVAEDGTSMLAGSARAENVKVQDENLNAHLLSPEFFDVERTPEITFSSREVALDGDRITVDGELTIKGETKPVELRGSVSGPLVDGYGRQRVTLKLETTVDRTDFGLDWNMQLPSGEPALPNDVVLEAELYLVRA